MSLYSKQRASLIMAFLCLVAISLLADKMEIAKEVYSLVFHFHAWPKALFYVLNYLAGAAALLFFLRTSRFLSLALVVVFSTLFTLDFVFIRTSGAYFSVGDLGMLKSASEHILPYLSQSMAAWLPVFLLFLLLLGGLHRLVWRKETVAKSLRIGLALLAINASCSALILHTSTGNRTSNVAPLKYSYLLVYDHFFGLYDGPRNTLDLSPGNGKLFDHILLIVDESVRGDLLEINGGIQGTTPYLSTLVDAQRLLNFGPSLSASVCSDYSNILLMTGLKPEELPDKEQLSRKKPTLFQYAKKAGYQTAFIDAQSSSDRPDGLMTDDDLSYIDHSVQVVRNYPGISEADRDRKALEVYADVLAKSRASFTYMIKFGCHFPYENTYPDSLRLREPIESIISWKIEQKKAVLNNYANCLNWSVDRFFLTLLEKIPSDQTVLIIYTADHGQNIMDDANIAITHCYKGPAPQVMASVPLFFCVSGDRSVDSLMPSPAVRFWRDQTSHFNLFPSILSIMGYSHDLPGNLFRLPVDSSGMYPVYFSGDIFGRSALWRNHR